ncbi:hypothetical protein ACFF2W_004413 [Enterobacter kobei]
MSAEKDTVDYTVRGFSRSFDRTLTDLSVLWNKPKSVILREIAEQHLTDRIKTFGMLNKIVAAMDEHLANHLGARLSDTQIENHFGTRWNMEMCSLLKIQSDADLENILVRNTPYITVRADQVMKGFPWIAKGTSLWFALFAEVAFSSEEIVKQAWEKIFYSVDDERYYIFYQHINEIREMRHLDALAADKNDFILEGEFCEVAVFKPAHYQYGAWRAVITPVIPLTPEAHEALTGMNFPRLPHRLIVADTTEPYLSPATDINGTVVPGFRFNEGKCELDIYSNGMTESFNPTSPSDVAQELAKITDVRLQPFVS